MEDEFLDDAEFYDGPDEHDGRPGQAYQELRLPRWATGERLADAAPPGQPAIPSWLHVPKDAPPPPKRLMTPEEFMASLERDGYVAPDPDR